jgi:hypothetical protein
MGPNDFSIFRWNWMAERWAKVVVFDEYEREVSWWGELGLSRIQIKYYHSICSMTCREQTVAKNSGIC